MCLSGTRCLACLPGYYLNSSKLCAGGCQPRSFASIQTSTCQPCPYDCLTCNYKGLCLSCSTTDFRILSTVTSRCVPIPTYFDNKTSVCAPCATGCNLCVSETYCINCLSGFFLNGNFSCLANCPINFYKDLTISSCLPCPFDCSSCDSKGNCLGCNQPTDIRILSGNSQRCVPVVGYFDNKTRVSVNCVGGCAAC